MFVIFLIYLILGVDCVMCCVVACLILLFWLGDYWCRYANLLDIVIWGFGLVDGLLVI